MNSLLALKMISRNLILNIIIILQISFTFLLTNVVICMHNSNTDCLKITENFSKSSTFLLMANDELTAEGDIISEENHLQIEKALKNYDTITCEQMYCEQAELEEEKSVNLYGFGKNTYEKINLTLTKGQKLNSLYTDGAIPCIISSKLDYNNDFIVTIGKKEVVFRPCGVINDYSRIIDLNISMNAPDFSYLFSDIYSLDEYTDGTIIFNYDLINKFDNSQIYSNYLLFDKSGNKNITDIIKQDIKNYGWLYSFEELYENGKESNAKDMTGFLPLVLCFLGVGIISSVCMVVLSNIKFLKNYSILYICGMNWIQSLITSLWYFFYHIICVFFTTLLLFSAMKNILPIYSMLVNSYNYIATISISSIFIIIYVISPLVIIKKSNPVLQLKESW